MLVCAAVDEVSGVPRTHQCAGKVNQELALPGAERDLGQAEEEHPSRVARAHWEAGRGWHDA